MKGRLAFKSLLAFVPLLVIYVIVVLIFSSEIAVGDETRHLNYAQNLTNGFYTDRSNPEIRNGPGYPLMIAPLTAIDAPYVYYRLLNAFLLVGAVVFAFKTISFYVDQKKSMLLTYAFGLYPPFLKWMTFIQSESLAIFLVCGFMYFMVKGQSDGTRKTLNLLVASCFLGFLILTKVLFSYVCIVLAIFYLLIFAIKKSKKAKRSAIVLAGALLVCAPFLAYTYSITGKTFYWGTQGGELLYWRSSPFPNEYGNWISRDVVLEKVNIGLINKSELTKNHASFIQSLEAYSHVKRDEKFKEKAVANIKEYPLSYAKNTVTSALRLFYNYPYSYTPQKLSSYVYILPNSVLLLFLLTSIYLVVRKLRLVPFEVRFIGLMALIFMGGLVLLNGLVRHLLPAIPLLFFFCTYVLTHLFGIKVDFRS